MAFRICATCEVEHVENCNTCFGFGLKPNGGIIRGEQIKEVQESGEWRLCPECFGNPYGIILDFVRYENEILYGTGEIQSMGIIHNE